jgi:lipase chaperone LimK
VLPPPVPAHVTAFQALEELERADLITKNQFQDYYLELTEIAKAYIEGRFGVPALDRTTDELRRDLERPPRRSPRSSRPTSSAS